MSTVLSNAGTAPKRTGRAAKQQAIVAAARKAFLRDGYENTSVDSIAELAGVSKQTIYNHGSDKDSLFLQVIEEMTGHCAHESVATINAVPRNSEDIAGELLGIAIALNERVLDPESIAFRPLIIAEAHRNPERGRIWATQNQGPMMEALADRLRSLVEDGHLAIEDPLTAADQFFALTTYQADRMTLNGVSDISIADLEPGLKSAIAMFMASYAR
jgi:TetR/AcrR family transcriptional repressor of mexJK operon